MKLMRLPWEGKSTPHGTLDIMGSCNITCKGCYNHRSGPPKPFEEIRKDLADMLAFRRLHTVTLTGGEVTLHPQLAEIVRYVSSQGIKTAIVTNGFLLDETMVRKLKAAGISLIIVHIQADQKRPDLPTAPTVQNAEELRRQKLELIADHGVEAGVAYIIYKNRLPELENLIKGMLISRHTSFALLTMYSDFRKFVNLRGSVLSGLQANPPSVGHGKATESETDVNEVLATFSRLELEPFSYVAASNSTSAKRWHVFLVGTVVHDDGSYVYRSLRSSLLERLLIRMSLLLSGRTPFFYKPSRFRFKGQVALNALLGGSIVKNLSLLRESQRNSGMLEDKHIVLQKAPELMSDGEVVFCRGCPDSTIQDGVLIPACLVDRMATNGSGGRT